MLKHMPRPFGYFDASCSRLAVYAAPPPPPVTHPLSFLSLHAFGTVNHEVSEACCMSYGLTAITHTHTHTRRDFHSPHHN